MLIYDCLGVVYVLYESRQFFMPSHACQYKRCTHIEVLEIELMTLHKDIRIGMSSPLKKTRKMSLKGSHINIFMFLQNSKRYSGLMG